MKYTIGSLSFKTKKDCHNYAKNIITGIGCKKVCKDDEHYTFLLSLLYNHDEYVEKIGAGIDYFFIVPNAINKTALQVMIKRIDNTEIDFSWVYLGLFILKQIFERRRGGGDERERKKEEEKKRLKLIFCSIFPIR
jgi:hypothetical protein